MMKEFFTLSDLSIKLRRNLLFVSSLCIIHFGVTSLSALKIFNVSIPKSFLDMAFPVCLVWFALNYFYLLYAEYTQWKSLFIIDVNVPEGMTDKSWKTKTLIPEVRQLTNNHLYICAEFSSGKSCSPPKALKSEEITADVEEMLVNIENQVTAAIKTDVSRIIEFQKAIKKYTLANQLRSIR